MFGPSLPQHDLHQAEQLSREQHRHPDSAAVRDARLGIRRPGLRERMRHWYRWLIRRKTA